MPLLGAIGNASEYSFRGTYDNYPFDINFGDLIDAEPGQIYTTILKLVEDINYKVPISITGDGEYYIGNVTFDKTFGNNYITFDQTPTTFDATFPELDYSTQPTYARNGNTIGLRIFGVPPTILNDNITVVDRSLSEYSISLSGNITIELRSGDYTLTPNNLIQIDNRTFQGSEVDIEYYNKTYSTTITIGKRDFTWTVKTKSAGKAQNLTFTNANKINYSTEIISDTYTVQGLTDSFEYTADITSNQGLLSVNYGEFLQSSPIKNGDILRLKLTSSSLNGALKNTTVKIALTADSTVGSISTTWSLTTLDSIPSNLSFNNVPNAELNSQILSDIVTIYGLSTGIDFDISITSVDGLLSVNGSTFVKNATIRNEDELQLRLDTSSIWLEEKNVVVQLENTSTTWKVRTRAIVANSDVNADKLIVALPYEEYYGERDATHLVRDKSGVNQTVTNKSYFDYSREYDPSISNLNSIFYTSSYKMAKGATTNDSSGGFSFIFRSEIIGRSDFTLEMWVYLTGYDFNGASSFWLYAEDNYPDLSTGEGLGVLLTSNLWSTGRGKIALNSINLNQNFGVYMGETSSGNLFNISQWNHIAITRSGNLFSIYVNGANKGSFSYIIDLPRTYFTVGTGSLFRAVNEDIYIQDLRLYKGIAKYTTNFNPNNTVGSIMEPYNPPIGDFYIDSAGRILILSSATPGKDPRTLSKTTGAVLPGTDSCIDDTRWQNFLSLAASGQDYRLTATLDNSTTKITNAAPNNIQRMLNANYIKLKTSLTDWQLVPYRYTLYALAWDENSIDPGYGSDYSILSWGGTTYYYGYYGDSSNSFFSPTTYSHTTANWWILPPGVPDF